MFVYDAKKEPSQDSRLKFNSRAGIETNDNKVLQRKTIPTSPSNNGNMLPSDVRGQFERRSGFSFTDVQIYYNSEEPAKMQAHAFTQGNRVHIGPNQEHCLEHELGHVVQQKKGIVKPTTQLNGIQINDDPQLEQEANTQLNTTIYNRNELNNNYQPFSTSNVIQRSAWIGSRPLEDIGGKQDPEIIQDVTKSPMSKPLPTDKTGAVIPFTGLTSAGTMEHWHILFSYDVAGLPSSTPASSYSNNIGFHTANPTKHVFPPHITGPGHLFSEPISSYKKREQLTSNPADDAKLLKAIHTVGTTGKFVQYHSNKSNCQHWVLEVKSRI
jgi:hypothetical protein